MQEARAGPRRPQARRPADSRAVPRPGLRGLGLWNTPKRFGLASAPPRAAQTGHPPPPPRFPSRQQYALGPRKALPRLRLGARGGARAQAQLERAGRPAAGGGGDRGPNALDSHTCAISGGWVCRVRPGGVQRRTLDRSGGAAGARGARMRLCWHGRTGHAPGLTAPPQVGRRRAPPATPAPAERARRPDSLSLAARSGPASRPRTCCSPPSTPLMWTHSGAPSWTRRRRSSRRGGEGARRRAAAGGGVRGRCAGQPEARARRGGHHGLRVWLGCEAAGEAGEKQ
jgi:hypothetical protein